VGNDDISSFEALKYPFPLFMSYPPPEWLPDIKGELFPGRDFKHVEFQKIS
jgi:hypothetical protein